MNSTIYEGVVSNSVVDYFNDLLFSCEQENYLEDIVASDICTVNGIQSRNVANRITKPIGNEIAKFLNDYVDFYYRNSLQHYTYDIDHIHIIKYNSGGFQKIHTHHYFEDHSFIICLNNSDGKTRFYANKDPVDIESKRNKIYAFTSAFFHEGLICNDERRIVVGSIRFGDKVWKPRY
jgi:hypothetical protein